MTQTTFTSPRPRGGLERALVAITIGAHQASAQRHRALSDTRTGQYEQAVQVPLSGDAANGWGYVDQPVAWEMPFLYAPLQHRVPFLTPHFNFGIDHTVGADTALVVIHAHVVAWTVTDARWYVGATVRFAAAAPAAGPEEDFLFEAMAHLSFRGYATMAEAGEFGGA